MSARIDLLGTVTSDVQMRYTPDGTAVVNFSLVTKETKSKARTPQCPEGWKESYNGKNWELATFWRITCWREQAEMVNQWVTKGNGLRIIGAINGQAADGTKNPRIWAGKDGTPRASFEVTAREIEFVPGRRGDSGDAGEEGKGTPPRGREDDDGGFPDWS